MQQAQLSLAMWVTAALPWGFPVIKQATQELEVSICVDLRWSDWNVGVSGLGEFLGERSDFSEEGATRFREDRAGV